MAPLASATADTIGLLATFLGIGVIVNVLIVYIVVLVLGERRDNQEYAAGRRTPER